MPNRSKANRRTTFQYQLASPMPDVAGGCSTASFNFSCCAWSRAGGNHRSARISGPQVLRRRRLTPNVRWCAGPCGSLARASAVAAAVQPCASSRMAYHRSRSRGVGARIIRRRKSLTPICHCSRERSISLTPITNPSQHRLPRFLHNFTPCVCAFHLGFGLASLPHFS